MNNDLSNEVMGWGFFQVSEDFFLLFEPLSEDFSCEGLLSLVFSEVFAELADLVA